MTRLALLVALLTLPGCRYSYTRVGHDAFVQSPLVPVPGETTVQELTRALGPPQTVTSRSGKLYLYYRYREIDNRSLILRYFGGQWLQVHDQVETDRSLVAVFGPDDRLELLAPSSGAPQ